MKFLFGIEAMLRDNFEIIVEFSSDDSVSVLTLH